MPEGDSVYRAAAKLDRALSGHALTRSDFRVPSLATRDVAGATVLETVPRGKHLLTRFDNGLTLHTHLRMDGAWVVQPVGRRWRKPWHTARVVLRTETTEAVGFSVLVDLVPTHREDRLVGHLGPDLLGPDWDAATAVANLRREPGITIGDALLEQRHLAGVGNVFKSEICFLSGIDPRTPVGEVTDLEAVVEVSRQQLEDNKERPFRWTTGDRRPGNKYWVYGRRGPCVRCGTPVQRADLGPPGQERPTYWCPRCQPRRPGP